MPDNTSCCTDVSTPSGRFLSIEPVLPPMCSSPPRLLFSATVPGSAFLFFPSHLSHCVSTITVHVTLSLCSPIASSNAFSALFFIRSRARSRNSQCIPTSFRYHSPSLVGCIGAPASMFLPSWLHSGDCVARSFGGVSVAFSPSGTGGLIRPRSGVCDTYETRLSLSTTSRENTCIESGLPSFEVTI